MNHQFRNVKKKFLLTGLLLSFVVLAARMSGVEEKEADQAVSPHLEALFKIHQSRDLDPTALFLSSYRCEGCHGPDPMGIANVTLDGVDINLFDDWETSMMGLAGVDPLWRAKVRQESMINPGHASELQNLCTSCHAPMGHYTAFYRNQGHYELEDLYQDSLGLSGVGCLGCHSIGFEGLGRRFTGDIPYDTSRVAYGPFFGPMTGPMQLYVGFTPAYSDHVSEGRFCSPCHTLITNSVDLEGNPTGQTFVEQATYHEWLNSSYPVQELSCQRCHMPQIEDPIKIAVGYTGLPGRTPYNLHTFAGANSFMVKLIKDNKQLLGINASDANFDSSLAAINRQLKFHTLDAELSDPLFEGDTVSFELMLTNKAGHKFPSGYPARRAWVEFTLITVEGDTLFSSGAWGADGEIKNYIGYGEPHHDVINSGAQVQIYEMAMGDVNGDYTTILERGYSYLKDNRLPPLGFTTTHAVYDTTLIVGEALTDPDFNKTSGVEGSGRDIVHYRVALNGYSGQFKAVARVHYQAVPPSFLNEMRGMDAPEINTFLTIYDAADKAPVTIAGDSLTELINPLSANSKNVKAVQVFPNPAASGQNIIFRDLNSKNEFSLYDMSGKLISVEKGADSYGNLVLKQQLKPGVYLWKSSSKGRPVSGRILIISH